MCVQNTDFYIKFLKGVVNLNLKNVIPSTLEQQFYLIMVIFQWLVLFTFLL